MADDEQEERYILELQLWAICFICGWLVAALATATLFLHFLLLALSGGTQIGEGRPLLGAVLAALIVSKLIVDGLWRYAKTSFLDIASCRSCFIPGLLDLDPKHAREQCHETNFLMILGFGWFSSAFGAMFLKARWSCATANPKGGFTNGVCAWYSNSAFLDLHLYVLRLLYASCGVAAVFFAMLTTLQILHAWQGSLPNKWTHSIYGNFWVNPRHEVYQVESNREDD